VKVKVKRMPRHVHVLAFPASRFSLPDRSLAEGTGSPLNSVSMGYNNKSWHHKRYVPKSVYSSSIGVRRGGEDWG
jgi:hypothetical protein